MLFTFLLFEYRVFQSLIKPQPTSNRFTFIVKYRVFQSLIKPQLAKDDVIVPGKYRVFQSLIKPQHLLQYVSMSV